MRGRGVPGKLGVMPGDTIACVDLPPALAAVLPGDGGSDAGPTLVFVQDGTGSTAAIPRAHAAFAPRKRLSFGYPKRSAALDGNRSALRFRPRGEIRRLIRASARA